MVTEEEIRKAFFEYAAHNELLSIDTPGYYARQILPNAPFFAKANVIADLIESGLWLCEAIGGFSGNEMLLLFY